MNKKEKRANRNPKPLLDKSRQSIKMIARHPLCPNPIMTAHKLAQLLLAGPDWPVGVFHDNDGLTSWALLMEKVEANNADNSIELYAKE